MIARKDDDEPKAKPKEKPAPKRGEPTDRMQRGKDPRSKPWGHDRKK